MSKRTGQHEARRAAAREEPSPITALRDMLATAFAADIAAVTPEVCEVLQAKVMIEAMPARREFIREALVTLSTQAGDLAFAIAKDMRTRFDARLTPGGDPFSKTARFSMGDLTLMEDSHLQMELALDHTAQRLKEQAAADLFQLTARVCEMLGRTSISDAENPVMPRVFARSLLESLATLGFNDEARLMVFKAYGPALLYIAPDLYQHANVLLAERGVLASFNATYGRPVLTASQAPAASRQGAPTDPKALAGILDRLLSGQKAHAL